MELGFLRATANKNTAADHDMWIKIVLNLNERDEKVTLGELASDGFEPPQIKGNADLELLLTAEMGDEALFPTMKADFVLHWDFDSANFSPESFGTLDIDFRNVRLSGVEFVTSLLGPILDNVEARD